MLISAYSLFVSSSLFLVSERSCFMLKHIMDCSLFPVALQKKREAPWATRVTEWPEIGMVPRPIAQTVAAVPKTKNPAARWWTAQMTPTPSTHMDPNRRYADYNIETHLSSTPLPQIWKLYFLKTAYIWDLYVYYFQASGEKEFTPDLDDLVKTGPQARPTVIRWAGGGKEVYIAGSFNNWNTKIPLNKR